MALVDTVVAFVVGLLIGSLGIYVGARVVTDSADFGYAVVTALIASIIWIVIAILVGWIPILGALLGLLVYIAVINFRYEGGWINAIAIALIAWVASLLVVVVLNFLGIIGVDAIGVPGV